MKILTVCLGNICRSPMAEGIIRHKVQERGLDVKTDSAGTANYHVGDDPDRRAMVTMKKHGIDISDLRGRQVCTADLDEFDLVLTMDEANYRNTLALAKNDEQRSRVHRLLSFCKENNVLEVPDPYYGGDDGFEYVYRLLDQASDELLDRIEKGKV